MLTARNMVASFPSKASEANGHSGKLMRAPHVWAGGIEQSPAPEVSQIFGQSSAHLQAQAFGFHNCDSLARSLGILVKPQIVIAEKWTTCSRSLRSLYQFSKFE